jgi:hypothetical protein
MDIEDIRPKQFKVMPSDKVTDFCYELVNEITLDGASFMGNDAALGWFMPLDNGPTILKPMTQEELDMARSVGSDFYQKQEEMNKKYWFSKIEEVYGINLSHLDTLNVATIAGELEKKLKQN